jgi:hypothetical protein
MKFIVAYLAVLFVSFQKGDQHPHRITNWKNLFALFLSCLTVTVLFFGIGLLGLATKNYHPVYVQIRTNVDVHDIINAIQSLHRSDAEIKTQKDPISGNWAVTIPDAAIGFMLMTGLVLFIYKHVCRWMKITPDI